MTSKAVTSLLLIAVMLLSGCASSNRVSTRMTTDDLIESTERMAQSLAASDMLQGRTPNSPQMVVTINRVQNLTSDIIPLSEQWMVIARVRNAMPIQELSQKRNIVFVIPPEQQQTLREAGYDADLGKPTLEPTHVMTATFLSAARTGQNAKGLTRQRTDLYYLEYSVFDLNTRQVAWSDRFEFKREASGLLID